MKPNETLLNTPPHSWQLLEEVGENHFSANLDTPLREDAFELDDELKIELIAKHFQEIMHILGLDLNDDSLQGTPLRVAKMYVKEIFSGLNPLNKPKVSLFEINTSTIKCLWKKIL